MLSFMLEMFLYLHVPLFSMTGVLEHLGWPAQWRQRQEIRAFPSYRIDRKAVELESAKEILRVVFGVSPAEVEVMIRLRLCERDSL